MKIARQATPTAIGDGLEQVEKHSRRMADQIVDRERLMDPAGCARCVKGTEAPFQSCGAGGRQGGRVRFVVS